MKRSLHVLSPSEPSTAGCVPFAGSSPGDAATGSNEALEILANKTDVQKRTLDFLCLLAGHRAASLSYFSFTVQQETSFHPEDEQEGFLALGK